VDGERVLGVDARRAGWVGITLTGQRVDAYLAGTIADLEALADVDGSVAVVAVDMPIGLPDRGRRQADVHAKAAIGALRSSVFMTPVRSAFDAADHRTATARNRALAAEGISVQAYSLKPKLLEVDRWVRQSNRRVVEIHPEVSFARLAGQPLTVRKTTWAGAQLRQQLLANARIVLTSDLAPAGHYAAVDDVLDAAVAAWTARRVLHGQAQPHPNPPEFFSDGLPSAIWS
jgi:predicted RNase H-like nuclease